MRSVVEARFREKRRALLGGSVYETTGLEGVEFFTELAI